MGFKCGIVGLPNVGKSTLFNALTQTAAAEAANYPFCTIEPNVGEVGVPDERLDKLAAIAKSGADHPDAADVRRHRRPGARRLQGRGARQQVSVAHPRGRRRRLRAALLRGRRHHPRREPHRSARRRGGRRDRADARRHGKPGKAPPQPLEKKAKTGDKEAKAQFAVMEKALIPLREGKPARMAELTAEEEPVFQRAAAADVQARRLCLQRRGSPRPPTATPIRKTVEERAKAEGAVLRHHLGQDRGRVRRPAAGRSQRIPRRDGADRSRASTA